MKPWLFDILACPMDKHFPLKLYIFSYETEADEFQSFFSMYEQRDVDLIKKEKIIKITNEKGELYLKDLIVIEKNLLKNYLEQIISSIDELNFIIDKSPLDISKKCFKIIISEVRDKIVEFSAKADKQNIDNILPELYLLNKIKIETEINSGVIFCEECLRWFPIIDTIPQMLPDEYRDKKKEIQFLQANKNLLDEDFLNQDLKPFNI